MTPFTGFSSPYGEPSCTGNVIEGNVIDGYAAGVTMSVIAAEEGPCRANIVRGNHIVVDIVHIPWNWGFEGPIGTDSSFVGVPVGLHNVSDEVGESGVANPRLMTGNVIEGNRIENANGLAISLLNASGNLIARNTVTGVRIRDPFPGRGHLSNDR